MSEKSALLEKAFRIAASEKSPAETALGVAEALLPLRFDVPAVDAWEQIRAEYADSSPYFDEISEGIRAFVPYFLNATDASGARDLSELSDEERIGAAKRYIEEIATGVARSMLKASADTRAAMDETEDPERKALLNRRQQMYAEAAATLFVMGAPQTAVGDE